MKGKPSREEVRSSRKMYSIWSYSEVACCSRGDLLDVGGEAVQTEAVCCMVPGSGRIESRAKQLGKMRKDSKRVRARTPFTP